MTDHNKNAATSFLKLASTGEVDEAYSKFVGEGFKHHNAFFEGSPESLMAGMEENARQNPDKLGEVKHAIAEADFVVVHSHVQQKPGEPDEALVHGFRFENGRIADLWDLAKPVWGNLDRIQVAISNENLK